jgi:ATP-dependent RNA helicase DDX5/DBP2
MPDQPVSARLTLKLSGLEADQKVIAAHGCYAMTATTALTAQNTLGVQDVHHTPPEFLQKQIDAVCSDIGVDVVKTGNSSWYTHSESLSDCRRYAGICGIH